MFARFRFALRGGNAKPGQKFKSKMFLQFSGRFIEGITPALDEIHLFVVEKYGNDSAESFGSVPFALRLPADAE